MNSSSMVQQARQGDAAAIAHLLNEALQVKGITVYCERQDSCLQLWLTSSLVPAPTPTVNYLRRGLKRLQVKDIHTLQVYAYAPDPAIPGWGTEVALAEEDGEVQVFLITAPTASDHGAEEEATPTADLAEQSAGAEAVLPAVEPEAATVMPEPIQPEPESIAAPSVAAPSADHPMAVQYAVLEIEPGTPLKAVSGQYFKLKALALKHGDRARVEDLKQAFYALKDYLEHNPTPSPAAATAIAATPSAPDSPEQDDPSATENASVVDQLEKLLRQQRISAQVALQDGELRVSWLAVRVANSEEVAEQLHFFLQSQDPDKLSQEGIQSLTVSSLTRDNAVVWQTSLPLGKGAAMKDSVSNIRRKVSLGLRR